MDFIIEIFYELMSDMLVNETVRGTLPVFIKSCGIAFFTQMLGITLFRIMQKELKKTSIVPENTVSNCDEEVIYDAVSSFYILTPNQLTFVYLSFYALLFFFVRYSPVFSDIIVENV